MNINNRPGFGCHLSTRLVASVVCSLSLTFGVDVSSTWAANFVKLPINGLGDSIAGFPSEFTPSEGVLVSVQELDEFSQTGQQGESLKALFGVFDTVKTTASIFEPVCNSFFDCDPSTQQLIKSAALIPDDMPGLLSQELTEPLDFKSYDDMQKLEEVDRQRQNIILDVVVGVDAPIPEKREAMDILMLANGMKLIDFLKEFPEETMTKDNLLPVTFAWLSQPELPIITPEPPILETPVNPEPEPQPELPITTPTPPVLEPPVTPEPQPEPPAITPEPPTQERPGTPDAEAVPEPSVMLGVLISGAVGTWYKRRAKA